MVKSDGKGEMTCLLQFQVLATMEENVLTGLEAMSATAHLVTLARGARVTSTNACPTLAPCLALPSVSRRSMITSAYVKLGGLAARARSRSITARAERAKMEASASNMTTRTSVSVLQDILVSLAR